MTHTCRSVEHNMERTARHFTYTVFDYDGKTMNPAMLNTEKTMVSALTRSLHTCGGP